MPVWGVQGRGFVKGRERRVGVEPCFISFFSRWKGGGYGERVERECVPFETRTRSSEGVRNFTSMICASGRERAQEWVSGVLLMPLTIGMAVW